MSQTVKQHGNGRETVPKTLCEAGYEAARLASSISIRVPNPLAPLPT